MISGCFKDCNDENVHVWVHVWKHASVKKWESLYVWSIRKMWNFSPALSEVSWRKKTGQCMQFGKDCKIILIHASSLLPTHIMNHSCYLYFIIASNQVTRKKHNWLCCLSPCRSIFTTTILFPISVFSYKGPYRAISEFAIELLNTLPRTLLNVL